MTETEKLLNQVFALAPPEQYELAQRVAANVGYVLTGEPEHPDSPHADSPAQRSASRDELLHLADQQACARARYNEDDADLIRESKVIEDALRQVASLAERLPAEIEAAIDRSPVTEAEIKRTGELARQFDWHVERAPDIAMPGLEVIAKLHYERVRSRVGSKIMPPWENVSQEHRENQLADADAIIREITAGYRSPAAKEHLVGLDALRKMHDRQRGPGMPPKIIERPRGSNADEWNAFLEEKLGHGNSYLAVQIAEAIEDAERHSQPESITETDSILDAINNYSPSARQTADIILSKFDVRRK